MVLHNNVSRLYQDFVSLIYPKICLYCKDTLVHQENVLCSHCLSDLPLTKYHLSRENPLFSKFIYLPHLKMASAFLHFYQKGKVQHLLHQLKYQGNYELGVQLGKWYAHELKSVVPGIHLILPVPLHKSKERKRGYNQSQAIAEGLSQVLEIPFKSNLVSRKKATTSQTKKSKTDRWLNMEGVFTISDHASIKDKNLLLVDDVITTGATIGMLAEALEKAGGRVVQIVSLAAG
jgi:ComF family protein